MFAKSTIGAIGTLCAGLLLFTAKPAAAGQGLPCSQCGPGAHWVDGCNAGQDQVADHGAVVGIDINLDCVVDTNVILDPCGAPDNLLTINRSGPLDDSLNFPGLRPVDAHLDVIDTEIVSMCLTDGGITLVAGAGQGQGGVLAASFGAIAEQPGNNRKADSFFDVFFEVDLGGGIFAYNQTALRIEVGPNGITCVPPQADYFHPTGCLPLFDSPTGGIQVANLVTAQHNVNPSLLYSIPAASKWSLGVLMLLMLTAGAIVLGRRRRAGEQTA